MKRKYLKKITTDQKCILCGNNKHIIVANRIRESDYRILQCDNCKFTFLGNHEQIDYTVDYGSLAMNNAGYDVYMTIWGTTMDEYIDIAKRNNLNILSDCSKLIND